MSRLDKLKDIVDEQLVSVTMSEQLKQRVRDGIAQAEAQGNTSEKRGLNEFARKYKRQIATIAAAAACVLVFFAARPFITSPVVPTEPVATTLAAPVTTAPPVKNINVTAQQQKPGGVSTTTSFIIQTESSVNEDDLRQALEVKPQIDYSLLSRGDGEFVLTPQSPLEKGAIYQIALSSQLQSPGDGPLTWVFQTESEFALISTLPAGNSTYVPLTTGIEITLSREAENADGKITLSPFVQGKTEYHGKTVVFVPTQPLEPDTVYTVSVSNELAAFTGETLAEGHSFSFRTAPESNDTKMSLYLSGEFSEAVATGDPIVVAFYSHGSNDTLAEQPFDVTVYELDGSGQYLDLANLHESSVDSRIGRSSDFALGTEGLSPVMSFETALLTQNSYSYFIVLPRSLAPGYYLIDARAQNEDDFRTPTLQKLICVSDIVVWTQSTGGETLVWLNDSSNGEALDGAAVTLEDSSAETDENGVATLTVTVKTAELTVAAEDGRTLAALVPTTEASETTAEMLYQAFIYIDRAAYLPSDTINYWGYISPRTNAELPQAVTISFDRLIENEVAVSSEGTFGGAISFENMLSTYSTMSVQVDGQTVTGTSVSIMDYIKPSYVLSASFDKLYYHVYDTMLADLTATFFDGTPAPALSVSASNMPDTKTTDQHGKALLNITPSIDWQLYSWRPYYSYQNIWLSGQEDGTVSIYPNIIRFPTDYMPEIEFNQTDSGVQVSANMSVIDFSAVDALMRSGEFDIYSENLADQIRGRSFDTTIRIEVVRSEYIATETGTQYNFITKQSYKTYRYDEKRTVVDTFDFTTQSGKALSKLMKYQSKGLVRYYINLTCALPDGITYIQSYWFPGGDDVWNSSDYKYYSIWGDTYRLAEDGEVTFSFYENGYKVANEGRLLSTVTRQTPESYIITSEDTFTFTYPAEYIPSIRLVSAYFDGRHVYSANVNFLYFDPAQRGLDIEITADKESYRPGETVNATISVTDKDGKARESEFVLSAADEAAFAVMEQYIDVLSALYQPIYYDYPVTFASTVQYSMNDMFAEGGGEGDSAGVREKFVDTAAFITGKTGADGTASVSFTLPDNLTSWRMTAAAVTPDARAGMGKANIPVSLPFFINPITSKKYVAGDDIMFSARSAGSAVLISDTVSYTATLSGAGADIVRTGLANASQYAYFDFGKLPVGNYTLNIKAEIPGYSDEIRVSFDVVNSLHEVPVSMWIDPAKLDTLKPLKYPVTLLISDPAQTLYLDAVMQALPSGSRADQRLGRAVALSLLSEMNPEIWADEQAVDLSNLQNYSGGVTLLPYSEADALLTAKMLAACPELIDERAAVQYLYGILYNRNSSQDQVAAAYLGLAAAKQPVLIDIQHLLETGGFETENELLLAWGLALLGDAQTAREWYSSVLAPYGVSTSPWLKIGLTGKRDTDYAITAQAAALTAACGHADSSALMRFTLDNSSNEYLATADILAWLSVTNRAQTASSFSYVRNGQIIAVDLSKTSVHVVQFTREQLAKADFQTVSGAIKILAFYAGSADDIVSNAAELISAEKKYSQNQDGTVTITINVTLDADSPDGVYLLTDVLPSGLRFVSAYSAWNSGWSLLSEDGGRQTFALYSGSAPDANGEGRRRLSFSVVYKARVALPGEFVADSAVVSHSRSNLNLVTGRSTVTLN